MAPFCLPKFCYNASRNSRHYSTLHRCDLFFCRIGNPILVKRENSFWGGEFKNVPLSHYFCLLLHQWDNKKILIFFGLEDLRCGIWSNKHCLIQHLYFSSSRFKHQKPKGKATIWWPLWIGYLLKFHSSILFLVKCIAPIAQPAIKGLNGCCIKMTISFAINK